MDIYMGIKTHIPDWPSPLCQEENMPIILHCNKDGLLTVLLKHINIRYN